MMPKAKLKGIAAVQEVSQRVAVIWFPDWPVYAVGQARGWDPLAPAAIIAEHKVYACNAAARRAGVARGMKQRHALAVCPQLATADNDPACQRAVHDSVVEALEEIAAEIETLRPGLLALPVKPLAKYYGDEHTAVQLVVDAAVRLHAECLAGVADDVITAVWAARQGKNIPAGTSADFLRTLPIEILTSEPSLHRNHPIVHTMVTVLQQLGVATLGDFTALPRAEIAARFGIHGAYWHRIACGEAERNTMPQRKTPTIAVRHELEEPISAIETTAFVARHVAARLHEKLQASGDACMRLVVRAYLAAPTDYEGPTMIERVWRCQEPLTQEDTAQRVRWQLEGWLTRLHSRTNNSTAKDEHAPDTDTSPVGVAALELIPIETTPAGHIHAALWGGTDEGIRAARAAAARAQALIGTHKVLRAIHRGGRGIAGRILTAPYGEEAPEKFATTSTHNWVGELLPPLPALVGVKNMPTHATTPTPTPTTAPTPTQHTLTPKPPQPTPPQAAPLQAAMRNRCGHPAPTTPLPG